MLANAVHTAEAEGVWNEKSLHTVNSGQVSSDSSGSGTGLSAVTIMVQIPSRPCRTLFPMSGL